MSNFAVIETGGKQYRVSPGDVIRVETLPVDENGSVEFDQVLMARVDGDVVFGHPLIEGAVVRGKVLSHGRGTKVIVFKYKARVNYRKMRGHRQNYTEVAIEDILTQAG